MTKIRKELDNTTAAARINIRHKESASIGNKKQLRMSGKRSVRNVFGSFCGSQAEKIDNLLNRAPGEHAYSKREIAAFCGTKHTRISNHISALKKRGISILVDGHGADATVRFEKFVSDTALVAGLKKIA